MSRKKKTEAEKEYEQMLMQMAKICKAAEYSAAQNMLFSSGYRPHVKGLKFGQTPNKVFSVSVLRPEPGFNIPGPTCIRVFIGPDQRNPYVDFPFDTSGKVLYDYLLSKLPEIKAAIKKVKGEE